jgi:hypothetical protein
VSIRAGRRPSKVLSADNRVASADDVLRADGIRRSRTYVAAFSGDQGPPEDGWIQITDGSSMDDKMHRSPDERWIYTLSNRDGFQCIWAYPVDAQTKKPAGPPVAAVHSHAASLSIRNANLVPQDFAVARDKIVFNQVKSPATSG